MKKIANGITINSEWDFVTKEINASNKGGTEKGEMLFEFQILLSALAKIKNPREKQMLASIYQKQKTRYRR